MCFFQFCLNIFLILLNLVYVCKNHELKFTWINLKRVYLKPFSSCNQNHISWYHAFHSMKYLINLDQRHKGYYHQRNLQITLFPINMKTSLLRKLNYIDPWKKTCGTHTTNLLRKLYEESMFTFCLREVKCKSNFKLDLLMDLLPKFSNGKLMR